MINQYHTTVWVQSMSLDKNYDGFGRSFNPLDCDLSLIDFDVVISVIALSGASERWRQLEL